MEAWKSAQKTCLEQFLELRGVVSDVRTRWNSELDMLSRFREVLLQRIMWLIIDL